MNIPNNSEIFFFILGNRISNEAKKALQIVQLEYSKEQLLSQLNGSNLQLASLSAQLGESNDRLASLSAQLGESNDRLASLSAQLGASNDKLASLSAQLKEREKNVQDLNSSLQEIYSSRGWKLVQMLWKIRLAIFPPGSRLEHFMQRFLS